MKNKKLYLLNIILVGIFLLTGNQTAAHVSGSSSVLPSSGNIELGEYLTESMVRKSFTTCFAGVIPASDSIATVSGKVTKEAITTSVGNTLYLPIAGCVIQAFFEKNGQLDSLYTTSNLTGMFSFKKLPSKRVVFKLQCMGYEKQSGVYELGAGENVIFFRMKERNEQIASAVVTSEIPLLKQLKDTTIFNTQAIRSLPEDNLKDVLAQIPGFAITGSGITVDGVRVARTYVNGVLIFGDDAMNAVNALKANEVTQVKVYDEQSAIDKRRGKKNSRKDRVLNVITKEQFISMTEAAAGVAGGADDIGQGRYGAAIAAEFNSEMTNLAATANLNNYIIGRSSLFASNLGDFFRPEGKLSQYQENTEAEMRLNKFWNNRAFGNSFSAIYNFGHTYNRSASQALTEYFQSDSNPEMSVTDSIASGQSQARHYMFLNLNLLDTPLKSISFMLRGAISKRNGSMINIRRSDNVSVGINQTHENSSDRNSDYSISAEANWTNNDVAKWRPYFKVGAEYGNSSNASWSVDTLSTSFLKRQLSSDGLGRGYAINGGGGLFAGLINNEHYTFDAGIFANFNYAYSHKRKMTLNEWDVPSPIMDIANSYDFTEDNLTSNTGFEFIYSNVKDLNIEGLIDIRRTVVGNNETIPSEFNNKLAFTYPGYKLSVKGKGWSVQSSSEAIIPSIEQIRKRISDSNPLFLVGGNPDLMSAQNFRIHGSFYSRGKFKNGNTSNLQLSADGTCMFKPIVSRSMYFSKDTQLTEWDGYIAHKGATLYTYQNAPTPSWRVEAKAQYSINLFSNRLGVSAYVIEGYGQSPQYAGDDLTTIKNWNNSLSIGLDYNPSRSFKVSNRITTSYLQSKGTDSRIHSDRLVVSNKLQVKWLIIPKLRFAGNYSVSAYNNISGYGKDNLTQYLNLGLFKTMLKDNSLELGLQGIDILNNGSNYSHSINALYMKEEWTQTYGQYFLFSIRYTFRNKK